VVDIGCSNDGPVSMRSIGSLVGGVVLVGVIIGEARIALEIM
jgi:hypothetical protein